MSASTVPRPFYHRWLHIVTPFPSLEPHIRAMFLVCGLRRPISTRLSYPVRLRWMLAVNYLPTFPSLCYHHRSILRIAISRVPCNLLMLLRSPLKHLPSLHLIRRGDTCWKCIPWFLWTRNPNGGTHALQVRFFISFKLHSVCLVFLTIMDTSLLPIFAGGSLCSTFTFAPYTWLGGWKNNRGEGSTIATCP